VKKILDAGLINIYYYQINNQYRRVIMLQNSSLAVQLVHEFLLDGQVLSENHWSGFINGRMEYMSFLNALRLYGAYVEGQLK